MKRLAMLLVFGSGCAATAPLLTVAPDARLPSALVVAPIHIDSAAASPAERAPLVEALKRAGLVVADEKTAPALPEAAIMTAKISSLEREVNVPPIGGKWKPFDTSATFAWVHYQVELRLVDSDGHELARAVGQVNDGARQRTELRQLLGAMAAQMAAGLPTHSAALARR